MITRRYREPRGLHSERAEYGFFVRVSGAERELLKQAASIAATRLGGQPSNPMLLLEMLRVYTGQSVPHYAIDIEDDDFI